MTRQLSCAACGEEEELTGHRDEEGIRITCDRCGTSWLRDAAQTTCATCGGTDLEHRPQPTTAYSRGTQISIVGWRQIPLCAACDADMLSRSLAGKPVPNHYRSAAKSRREPGQDTDPHSILPR